MSTDTYEDRVTSAYRRSAAQHPGKVARALKRYEAKPDLSDDDRLRLSAARQALRSVGRCERCGRSLTDPDSVARGIGPECIKALS